MKLSVKLLLLACLLLLINACGVDSAEEDIPEVTPEINEQELLYDKYKDLITLLENGDFSGAHESVTLYEETAFNAAIQNEDVQLIDISDENVSEYFSVVKITEWTTDPYGNPDGFITHVCIVLNEVYANQLISDRTDVAFTWGATCSVKNCLVDYDNKLLSIENVFKGATTNFGAPEYLTGTVSFSNPQNNTVYVPHTVVGKIGEIVIIGEYLLENQMKPVCFDYENVEIIHASGTVALKNTE